MNVYSVAFLGNITIVGESEEGLSASMTTSISSSSLLDQLHKFGINFGFHKVIAPLNVRSERIWDLGLALGQI
jgi:hypothetical protein